MARTTRYTFAKLYLLNGGDLFSLQRILGRTTLDMVRRYVNLDTDEVKRPRVQASPVDRLAIGPKVLVLLPWREADRLIAITWSDRTTVEAPVQLDRDGPWLSRRPSASAQPIAKPGRAARASASSGSCWDKLD